MLFDEWLEVTRVLQRTWYAADPQSLEGEARAEYVRWNVLAADHELHEFLDHIQWKPWSSRQGELRDRDDAVEELVDTLHFVANLLLVLDVDGDELNEVYQRKVELNSARQETGYDSFGKADGSYEDPVRCSAHRCEKQKHPDSEPHKTDGYQWYYTNTVPVGVPDLLLAKLDNDPEPQPSDGPDFVSNHAAWERRRGRESVRHPATRRGPGGVQQWWNNSTRAWEAVGDRIGF